jgi:2-methylfumaryl-CoA isomerase
MGWADGTPAVDYTINAAVGLPMITGHSDDPRPVNHVLPAWDLLAGAYGAFALLAAERDRRAHGRGREIRLALSDLAAATLGHLGQVAEVLLGGRDRPRSGNDLFGAFGRDFLTADSRRVMVVAITSRQWTGLINSLALAEPIAALEAELRVSFKADEGMRFIHRSPLNALVERAVAKRTLSDLGLLFDANGVTWSSYNTLEGALQEDPRLLNDNPIFSTVVHGGGDRYPTPGAAVRLPQDDRAPASASPLIGAHTDEVLASLLGMPAGEIGRLHDEGVVA